MGQLAPFRLYLLALLFLIVELLNESLVPIFYTEAVILTGGYPSLKLIDT